MMDFFVTISAPTQFEITLLLRARDFADAERKALELADEKWQGYDGLSIDEIRANDECLVMWETALDED